MLLVRLGVCAGELGGACKGEGARDEAAEEQPVDASTDSGDSTAPASCSPCMGEDEMSREVRGVARPGEGRSSTLVRRGEKAEREKPPTFACPTADAESDAGEAVRGAAKGDGDGEAVVGESDEEEEEKECTKERRGRAVAGEVEEGWKGGEVEVDEGGEAERPPRGAGREKAERTGEADIHTGESCDGGWWWRYCPA